MEIEITAHEPEEEVVNTLEEIEKDVQSLTEGLIEVRVQRLAKNVPLLRSRASSDETKTSTFPRGNHHQWCV